VGWLPPGLAGQQAEVAPWEQSFGARDRTWVSGGPDVGLVVDLLAKGHPASEFSAGALGLPMNAVEHPTAPIRGGTAFCLSDPRVAGSCAAIRWRYAPDAWARVSYAGTAGPTPAAAAAVARRVAESVTLTAGEPVRLPFTVSGALSSQRVARTLVSIDDPAPDAVGDARMRWSADLELVPDGVDLSRFDGGRPTLSVSASQLAGDPSGRIERDSPPNTTVDGHPAALSSDHRFVVVFGVNATRVGVGFLDRSGDPIATYADVHVIAAPSDPANWVAVR